MKAVLKGVWQFRRYFFAELGVAYGLIFNL